jgi:hypothetical protein
VVPTDLESKAVAGEKEPEYRPSVFGYLPETAQRACIDYVDEIGWCATFVDTLAAAKPKPDGLELRSRQYGSIDIDQAPAPS